MIGILWALLQPIVTTIIFTLVFVVFIRVPSQNVPYPVFAFAGLVIWQYFNRAVSEVSDSARRLLASLQTNAPARDRDVEAEKARERSRLRFG